MTEQYLIPDDGVLLRMRSYFRGLLRDPTPEIECGFTPETLLASCNYAINAPNPPRRFFRYSSSVRLLSLLRQTRESTTFGISIDPRSFDEHAKFAEDRVSRFLGLKTMEDSPETKMRFVNGRWIPVCNPRLYIYANHIRDPRDDFYIATAQYNLDPNIFLGVASLAEKEGEKNPYLRELFLNLKEAFRLQNFSGLKA